MSVRIVEDLSALPSELDALGARKVLVLTTPGRRFVDRLGLGDRLVAVFDQAVVHVPKATVEDAERKLLASGADTVLSVGGGSATGLGKALRMRHDVRFVAIPTTWSGSEMTRIWGTTADGRKETGRDERVRPDLVVHAQELFATMPRRLAVTSLLNALAHPISALSTGPLDEKLERQAFDAIRHLSWALDALLEGGSAEGRASALRGMRLGAGVLDQAAMGVHHKVAHILGGAFGVEHGALHAVLLPHSLRPVLEGEHGDAIVKAMGTADPPARIYDALVQSGAGRSLIALGVDPPEFEAVRDDHAELEDYDDALVGRRPSVRERRWALPGQPEVSVYGPDLGAAKRVIVALHGRGADAGSVAKLVADVIGYDDEIAIVAPQAPAGVWYPLPYRRSLAEHGAGVPRALAQVEAVLARVLDEAPPDRVALFGFSQGACLACEVFARTAVPLRVLVAPGGARIGAPGEPAPIARDLDESIALLGASREDKWLVPTDIAATAESFRTAGAGAWVLDSPGDAHIVTALQRRLARAVLTSPRTPPHGVPHGFGGHQQSEMFPNALPRHQNNPREIPYGLIGEHISGSGFTAMRAENQRTWTYRARPSAQHSPFVPLPHPTLVADWTPVDANLAGWRPIDLPMGPTDFVDGLCTLGGAGSADLRRGYAIHLYAANRSMDDRSFCNADGDLLIVPWQGALWLLTELGFLAVDPGHIAVVPQGMKFSVLLADGTARGWVGEAYGRHFVLPERGPVGANGLAEARHFKGPNAWFEDRLAPAFRLAHKVGNRLFEATQDHSPYDVAAWQGNHVPYTYDLMDFSPVANARVDHIDPSVHTVLHAPLDEAGASALDFVLFAPRWDVSEHTFRPPYFHRNVTTEFNGIISDPTLGSGGVFHVGASFLTPSFTPHGVLAASVERALVADDHAKRIPEGSLWFQFEAALPLQLTEWARNGPLRIADWPSAWGTYRSHFTPP